MNYWLMKSEPDVFGLEDLKNAPAQTTAWEGVRNYQARNFMRDLMRVGDKVLFYHSNTQPPGIAGLAKIARTAYPDFHAWDPASPYFDPKSNPEQPRWLMVDVQYVATLPCFVSLAELRAEPSLAAMKVLQKGQRLSIQPVTAGEYRKVCEMGGWSAND
jgi:predicted RNA-binding protein with PUA-like domain